MNELFNEKTLHVKCTINAAQVIVVTKSGGEGECNIKLNITDRVDRVPHDVEVPLWMEENNNFQTEAVISPRGEDNCVDD